MALAEDAAARIVLIRSIEESEARAFSEEMRARAFAAAEDETPGLKSVERYSTYLFERLSPGYQSIVQLAKVPAPWTVPICSAAFVAGLATNLLGPAREIHVIRNPVFVLIAWNLLVYLTSFVLLLRHAAASPGVLRPQNRLDRGRMVGAPGSDSRKMPVKAPWTLKYLFPALWQFLHRMVFGFHEQKSVAAVIKRFSLHWLSAAGDLVRARWRRVLHLGSVFLAAGAVAGMYFRGLLQGYRVVWDSTFITDEASIASLIHLLFGPSLWLSNLLGLGLGTDISVARLLTAGGDHASSWIHLFAISVLIAIVIPRALLAAWQAKQVNRLSESIAFPLDHYYGQVIEGPLRSSIETEVAARVDQFAADVASFVGLNLFEQQIVPRLKSFRESGGKIADLKADLTLVTEAFLPQVQTYIADSAMPEFQRSLSQRIGEMLRSIGTSFVDVDDPQHALRNLPLAGAAESQLKISNEFSRAIGVSIGTSVALAVAAVAGGLGEELGIAIVATVLGTTGPIGFLIGLIGGAVIAAGAWWVGKEKLTETVEKIYLPAAVLRAALWPARFQRILEEARQKCEESVRNRVDERLQLLVPKITNVILGRLRGLWQS